MINPLLHELLKCEQSENDITLIFKNDKDFNSDNENIKNIEKSIKNDYVFNFN